MIQVTRFISLSTVVCAAACLALGGCAGTGGSERAIAAAHPSFAAAKIVLENHCVHCHGDDRLINMPPFDSTAALAQMVADGIWIVPGKPERSRFYQVVTLADEVTGAMPPTGHAISREEMQVLSDWIQVGAPLPEGASIKLKPRGKMPRSN